MPKLKEPLFAVPEGEIYPKWFEAGEEVSGSVAAAAKEMGLLEDAAPVTAPELADTKPQKRGRPPKTKAMSAPENK